MVSQHLLDNDGTNGAFQFVKARQLTMFVAHIKSPLISTVCTTRQLQVQTNVLPQSSTTSKVCMQPPLYLETSSLFPNGRRILDFVGLA